MPELSAQPHAHPIDPDRVAHARARLPTPDDAARLTSLLSLMADPVRIRILYALDLVEELSVGDLALALGVNEDQTGYALRLRASARTPPRGTVRGGRPERERQPDGGGHHQHER